MGFVRVVLLWSIALHLVAADPPIVNVMDNGAVGDGRKDDSQAFLKAWGAACCNPGSPTFLIPSGKLFLLGEVIFSGPCRSNIHVQLSGNIVAPNQLWTNKDDTNLITFKDIDGITMDGGGQINGQGAVWWACLDKNKCNNAPKALGFLNCKNIQVSSITIRDSPGKQMTFYKSVGVHVNGVTITAPEDSPNTDGILISASQHVEVVSSTIGTGDDCIAIIGESSDVNISGITCGPGHGISIGSLGGNGAIDTVQQVRVSQCNISNALNGVRIKTWQGGSGFAKGIVFQNINFNSVKNPIVIDQFYCPDGKCHNALAKGSDVALSDIQFIDLHGTSINKVAISIDCSSSIPCTGIILNGIRLSLSSSGDPPQSYCANAHGKTVGEVIPPVPCLN